MIDSCSPASRCYFSSMTRDEHEQRKRRLKEPGAGVTLLATAFRHQIRARTSAGLPRAATTLISCKEWPGLERAVYRLRHPPRLHRW